MGSHEMYIDKLNEDITRLTAELAEARVHFEKVWGEKNATIDRLTAELAEALEDSARLDWLDNNGDRLGDALMTRWIKLDIDIRAAIDAGKVE